MPTIIKVHNCDFTIEDYTSQHISITNVRLDLKKDIYGISFYSITFDVHYIRALPSDIGQGMGIGYDLFDTKGFKVADGAVFMPKMRVGEKARAEIQAEFNKVEVSFFGGRFKIVV